MTHRVSVKSQVLFDCWIDGCYCFWKRGRRKMKNDQWLVGDLWCFVGEMTTPVDQLDESCSADNCTLETS